MKQTKERSAAMQVSNDVAVKFISSRSGANSEGKPWYRLTVTDEAGDIVNMYTDAATYAKAQALQFGQPCQFVIRLTQGRSGIMSTVIDLIAGK